MRIGRLWGAATGAAIGLVALVTVTAVSSADGAPRGSVLAAAAPAKVTPARIPVKLGECSAGHAPGPSSIRLEGSCRGSLTGGFACVRAGELEAISIRRSVGHGRVLYLTIVISEFEGPGDYSQDVATAQVIGYANAPRWTSIGSRIAIHVSRDGVFDLDQGVLLPEPGTPASGVITLEGRAVCR